MHCNMYYYESNYYLNSKFALKESTVTPICKWESHNLSSEIPNGDNDCLTFLTLTKYHHPFTTCTLTFKIKSQIINIQSLRTGPHWADVQSFLITNSITNVSTERNCYCEM